MTGMDTGVAFEIRVFFLCGLCGVACSVVYDLFRIARRCLKTGAAATFVLDLLFWLSSAYLTFSMVFYANYGRVRWYEFFGLLLGGFVYAALYPGVYFIANPVTLGFCGYTGIFAAATLGLCALFYHWLKNEGCRRFEAL